MSATQLFLFCVFHPSSWLPVSRVRMQCTLPCLDRRRYLQILVLLAVLAMISTEWAITHMTHNSKGPLVQEFADFDKHVKTISGGVGLGTSRITHVEQSVNTLSAKMALFAEMEQKMSAPLHRMSAPSLHARARLKEMLPLRLAFPARQDLGIYLDSMMAPQPLGPIVPWPRII